MPLLDHFHAPLDERYPWESFHSGWATRIADQLSERVPAEFVVAEHTHSGNHSPPGSELDHHRHRHEPAGQPAQ
jgi:hypothetical protein